MATSPTERDVVIGRTEQLMIHPRRATEEYRHAERPGAPVIQVSGGALSGAGFLPAHDVTVCIVYCSDDVVDYLTYSSGPRGELRGELPISHTRGILRVTATDHRCDPTGVQGLLWSNTEVFAS